MQLTPKEGYALMNLLVDEATGVNGTISVVDTSSFVSAAETVLATGKENVLNSLSILIARTLVFSTPYSAKFRIINEESNELYEQRVRVLIPYDDKAVPEGSWNTDLYTNLAQGYDNNSNSGASVASQWEQNRCRFLEQNFAGMVVWSYGRTIDEDAFKVAFNDVNSFTSFVSAIMTELENDLEQEKEAFRRMVFLNRLAESINTEQTYGTAVNMTAAYNAKFGTQYTSEQLRTTYLKSFLEFMVSYIKNLSNMLEYRSKKYHNPYTITEGTAPNTVEYNILTHTPKSEQKMILFRPLIILAEAMVMPEIFNDNYLKIDNYEGVDFWQNIENPSAIKVTPTAVVNGAQTTGSTVDCPYIIGAIFSDKALRCGTFLDEAYTTDLEKRKKYRNIWIHIAKKSYDNDAFPFITLYMADPTPEPEPEPEPTTNSTRKTSK
jgi:hypothetical protein